MLTSKGFDQWAYDYDRAVNLSDESNRYPFAGYHAVLNRIYQEILTVPGAQVLDLGFGTGMLAQRLYEHGFHIYGQDFSKEMVDIAQSKMPKAQLFQGDFSKGLTPALEERSYDFIVATYSLHHLTDQEKLALLTSLLPKLKNGGKILIGDIAFATEAQQKDCQTIAGDEWDDEEHYWIYDRMAELLPCPSQFETCSHCAGVLTLTPPECEQFDIVDDQGEPTGDIISRSEAHRLGIQHRTAHVWILRQTEGTLQILLQKRANHKDSFPGCYDISSAGHIPAGTDYIPSALRELEEELGVVAKATDLHYCGTRRFTFKDTVHGLPFHDRQVTQVFLLWLDQPAESFIVQEEEISHVKWFDWEACRQGVASDAFPHCIYTEELDLLAAHLE